MEEANGAKKRTIENVDPDRISDLPDAILHHIFSFLDTRYAVQASLLSSRFDFLWGSMQHLKFFSDTSNTDNTLETLINKVLILRGKYDIKSFHLYSDNVDDIPHVYTWILAAIRHNVREIDICMSTRVAIDLPHFMFTSDHLTVLKLALGNDFPRVMVPEYMDLPRLKFLQFTRVGLCYDFQISQLISCCPSLQTLIIVDSVLSFEEEFEIDSIKLEHLGVQCRFPESHVDVSEFKVKIDAPNLKVFRWEDYMAREFIWFEKPPHLDEVEIGLVIDEEQRMALDNAKEDKQMQARYMLKLLEAVSNVNSLTLYGCYHLVTFEPSTVSECLSLQYHSLKYLKLETWLSADCLLATFYMLKICPNVEALSLHILENDCLEPNHRCWDEKLSTSWHVEKCWEAESSKLCIAHNLKVVEIHGVRGCMIELMLLEILLKGAKVLEKIVICTSEEKSSDREKGLSDFRKKLRALPRASSAVAFVFCTA